MLHRELNLRAMKRLQTLKHTHTHTRQPLPIVRVRVRLIQPDTCEQLRVNENEPGQVKTNKLMKRNKNNVLLVLFFN